MITELKRGMERGSNECTTKGELAREKTNVREGKNRKGKIRRKRNTDENYGKNRKEKEPENYPLGREK